MFALSLGGKIWIAFGGLLVLSAVALAARELPAIRRELRILRM